MTGGDSVCTQVRMDTPVTIQVPGNDAAIVDAAFAWFDRIEACCSRFNPRSELMQLTGRVGTPVPASPILFEAVQFALTVAQESGGAFDPTVGHLLEARGFNREYSTGARVTTAIAADDRVSYRDVMLDPDARTITLRRPLVLDLGAVAKGLAIDMAAHELRPLGRFAIDAGGDLYLAGARPDGGPWSVGIRHPRPTRPDEQIIESLRVSDMAVCTSGDYERRSSPADGHHIVDPRTRASADRLASVTVIAPTAMCADAIATAAFVLGPDEGLALCERLGVEALMLTPSCERIQTRGMRSGQYRSRETLLQHTQGAAARHPAAADDAGRAARGA